MEQAAPNADSLAAEQARLEAERLAAERARLEKEREKLSKDEQKLAKKLSNQGFLAKAAPEIIEKDRAKHADLAEKIARIDEQLADLA